MRYKMRCKLSTPGSPQYILPVTPSISATPVSPNTRRRSVRFHHPGIAVHPPSSSPSPSSLYLRTPTIAQSSAKLSDGGGERLIFPPRRPNRPTPSSLEVDMPGRNLQAGYGQLHETEYVVLHLSAELYWEGFRKRGCTATG
jgi:hypothetical protein